jgi:hypothetical protein
MRDSVDGGKYQAARLKYLLDQFRTQHVGSCRFETEVQFRFDRGSMPGAPVALLVADEESPAVMGTRLVSTLQYTLEQTLSCQGSSMTNHRALPNERPLLSA